MTKIARIYNPKSSVPANHWGIVLGMADWKKLRDKFTKLGITFFMEPRIVMKGKMGEQMSMFIEDPEGNAIEFKAFTHAEELFKKE